jgi:PelA/Pel-15E family pectate lyase
MAKQRRVWGQWLPAVCTASLMLLTVIPPSAAVAETGNDQAAVRMIKAEATGKNTIEITFDGPLTAFDPADIEIDSAMGDWLALNPKLTPNLSVESAEIHRNTQGQSVAVLQTVQALKADATITRPANEDPASLRSPYYKGDPVKDKQQADYLLSWQMDNGGWYKYSEKDQYGRPWDGQEKKSDWRTREGGDIGTIDNNATTKEMLFLALMYKQTGDTRYRDAVKRGVDFLLTMQYPSGGWPQVYPARGNYSDYVTYNDNAMMHAMETLTDIAVRKYPYNSDIADAATIERIHTALERGVEYILKSQIVSNGRLTAWCAQHDPVTYEPREARAYEHPSISGSESVEIVKYLMSIPHPSEAVKKSVNAALQWFRDAKVPGMKYVSADPNGVYFVPDPNSTIWYRFYEICTGLPIFSGRDGVIKHSILEIEKERRDGYAWAGTWPQKLLSIAETTGYYENRVYVKITGAASHNDSGQTLEQGQLVRVEDRINPTITLDEPGRLTGNHYNTKDHRLTVTGKLDEPGDVKVNGVSIELNEDLSFRTSVNLVPGMNTITVNAVDWAGNESTAGFKAVPNNGG